MVVAIDGGSCGGICAGVGDPTAVGNMRALEATASQVTIQCKMYTLGGQAVAVRVSGDPVTGNNGLHYLYSDHRKRSGGSDSAMLKDENNSTPIITRYTPFGEYRSGSASNDITDLGTRLS